MRAPAKKRQMELSSVGRKVVVCFALIVTLDVSVQEFAELLRLPDDARRVRFELPEDCTPIIGAARPAAPSSGRLKVFVDCKQSTEIPALSPERASWKNE